MKRIFLLILGLSALLMAELKSIDAQKLLKMQKSGIPVIDIRTPSEWKSRGVIQGAHLLMFFDENGAYDARKWLEKLSKIVKDKQEPFILYCAHANRTKAVGNWLSQKMGYQKVYELKGGIEYGWREKGMPVVKPKN